MTEEQRANNFQIEHRYRRKTDTYGRRHYDMNPKNFIQPIPMFSRRFKILIAGIGILIVAVSVLVWSL